MKNLILDLLRSFGFFRLSKFLSRKKLLILAYHGVEMNDESEFRPKLFIRRTTLEQRMEYLHQNGFNILSLNEALTMLNTDILPKNSIVITVDDGWYSTLYHANRIFSKYAYPYTIYVTSYYAKKELPVLNVALSYILWSSLKKSITLDLLGIPLLSGQYSLSDTNHKDELERKLFMYFNQLTPLEKVEFVKKIANFFDVDYKNIESQRFLGLLSFSEIQKLSHQEVDIQLHTHRHSMTKLEEEINENRKHLSPYVKNKLGHFCYPSGQYDNECGSVLKNMGILSATTCEPGFITPKTDSYYLPRFLDGENIPQIIFEAEVCGVSDILRRIRGLIKF